MEGRERVDLRLNLRNQLRRLITKIKVNAKDSSNAMFFQSGERRLITLKEDGSPKILDAYPRAARK